MYKDDLLAAHLRIQELEQKLRSIKPKEKKVKEKKPKGYWWGDFDNDWYGNNTILGFSGLGFALFLSLIFSLFLFIYITNSIDSGSYGLAKDIRNEMGRIVCKDKYVSNEPSLREGRREYKCLVSDNEYKIIIGVDPYK